VPTDKTNPSEPRTAAPSGGPARSSPAEGGELGLEDRTAAGTEGAERPGPSAIATGGGQLGLSAGKRAVSEARGRAFDAFGGVSAAWRAVERISASAEVVSAVPLLRFRTAAVDQ
jgi:hypothetical protein